MAASKISARPTAAGERGRETAAPLVAVTLLAAVVRFFQLDANGFDLDETWSVWMARQDVGTIVQSILLERADATPPTFYVLLHPLLALSEHPVAVRLLSVLAGAASVWFTYRLAAFLFDRRLALGSALLVALAPYHIQFSQVGRAYMLAALCVLVSLYFFARLVFAPGRRSDLAGTVLATAAGLYTFYVTALVLVFQYLVVFVLLLRRQLSRQWLVRWVAAQVALGLLLLPVLLPALGTFARVEPGRGQAWLGRPGLEALVKTAILFTTGDPSYGPTGFTLARLLSLGLVGALGLAGLWLCYRRGWYRRLDGEAARVLFLAGAALLPWLVAFAVSQLRPVYHERYLLFVIPPWATLVVWVLTRLTPRWPRVLLAAGLAGLLAAALWVQATEPEGEQWREAVAEVEARFQPGDAVVIAPGFYSRPFAYYADGAFPAEIRTLARYPAVAVKEGAFVPVALDAGNGAVDLQPAAVANYRRLWYVYGYAPVSPAVSAWVERDFVTLESRDYLGAHVRLLQRAGGLALDQRGP